MPQSGSTLLFNIISKILEVHGVNHNTCLYGPKSYNKVLCHADLKDRSRDSLYLVKEHHFERELAQMTELFFISRRDIRDSIASRRRRGKGLFSKGKRARGLHQYDETKDPEIALSNWCSYLVKDCYLDWLEFIDLHHKDSSCFIFDYDNFNKDYESKCRAISSISLIMEKKLSQLEIERIIDETSVKSLLSSNIAQNKNFFSIDKITNVKNTKSYRDDLSEKEIGYIMQHYSNFIK